LLGNIIVDFGSYTQWIQKVMWAYLYFFDKTKMVPTLWALKKKLLDLIQIKQIVQSKEYIYIYIYIVQLPSSFNFRPTINAHDYWLERERG